MKEKFKLDENLPEAALALFRKNDFDAANVIEEQLAGATDECILTVCRNENGVLVTQDLDFSDITLLSRTEIPGIIIFRLKTQSRKPVSPSARPVTFGGQSGCAWPVPLRGERSSKPVC